MSDTPIAPQEKPQDDQATMHRLLTAVDRAYNRPWLMMWRSFLHGFMTALGATIGTALFFTILVWFFQRLGGIDLLAPQIEKLQDLLIPDQFQNENLSELEQTLQDNNLQMR
jgi:hypothetical protein